MTLIGLASLSWPWWIRECFNLHYEEISIFVLAVAAECITIPVSIYSVRVMLGFGGCWALWETIQLLGEQGGVSRQGDSLSRMIMSGTDYGGARREKSPTKHTHRSTRHILRCGLLVILCLQIKELGLSCFKCCKRGEVVSVYPLQQFRNKCSVILLTIHF